MPKGTKVAKCVDKVKPKMGSAAYPICQKSTGQSYATGKPIKSKSKPTKVPKEMNENPSAAFSARKKKSRAKKKAGY